MSFYGVLASLRLRKNEKDYDKAIVAITDAYLGRLDRNNKFKTPAFALLGTLLDNSSVFANGHIILDGNDEKTKKLNAVLKAIANIKNGEVADLKSYSLSAKNLLVIQNNRNMYKKGELKAEDILTKSAKYNESLCKEVYVDYVKTASMTNINKYKKFLTKDALMAMLTRINAKKNTLEATNESILLIAGELDLNDEDYMAMSKVTSSCMIPEQRIKFFEIVSLEDDNAMNAYIFTLFDLEMLDLAYDILDISQPDEYQNFKAFRALKENNQHFSIELFI